MWQLCKVIFMHQYRIIYLSAYICIPVYSHSFYHGKVGYQDGTKRLESMTNKQLIMLDIKSVPMVY
jgi:hypothetical protein